MFGVNWLTDQALFQDKLLVALFVKADQERFPLADYRGPELAGRTKHERSNFFPRRPTLFQIEGGYFFSAGGDQFIDSDEQIPGLFFRK